jgi:hypothetical protein
LGYPLLVEELIKLNNLLIKLFILIGFLFISARAIGVKSTTEALSPTLKILTTDELRTALAKVPTQFIIPPLLRNTLKDMGKDNDREFVLGLLKLNEIKDIAWLNSIYPNVRLFKGVYTGDLTKEPFIYLMAVKDNDCYFMPDEFNRLFRKSGIKISNRNIIPLAKAIVMLILGGERVTRLDVSPEKELVAFPQITFLEGKRIKEVVKEIPFTVKLKVKVNEQVEDWFFNVSHGQFYVVSRGDPKQQGNKYTLPFYDALKYGPWWRK